MMCPNGCRKLVESDKQFIEFPIKYKTGDYTIGYALFVRTCPDCDYTELVKDETVIYISNK